MVHLQKCRPTYHACFCLLNRFVVQIPTFWKLKRPCTTIEEEPFTCMYMIHKGLPAEIRLSSIFKFRVNSMMQDIRAGCEKKLFFWFNNMQIDFYEFLRSLENGFVRVYCIGKSLSRKTETNYSTRFVRQQLCSETEKFDLS